MTLWRTVKFTLQGKNSMINVLVLVMGPENFAMKLLLKIANPQKNPNGGKVNHSSCWIHSSLLKALHYVMSSSIASHLMLRMRLNIVNPACQIMLLLGLRILKGT
ncbi:hypothetical protein IEQ34_020288 [Dendrobium chrysotoxum]|uniref:Uncharacterized protein n=1 Tax=Dendrobium chrysotoxum TaxID=161865 RepID=A0AAV7FZR5_DENCH|nr:hypothetical protein IEQ34_020288 [Dendrobium chrysotoxum]